MRHEDLVSRLLPILKKGKTDIYLCGHDHNMQELKPEDGVHFFVVGSGGADLYGMDENYPRSVFKSQAYGFGVLEVARDRAVMSFVGLDGKALHRREIVK